MHFGLQDRELQCATPTVLGVVCVTVGQSSTSLSLTVQTVAWFAIFFFASAVVIQKN